jgi:YegS/Rv2252/BmrU family lipid kinase
MRLLFVINPISGGKAKDLFVENVGILCQKYGIDFRIFQTTGKGDIEKLKHVVTTYHPDRVAAVGGDGTSLLVAVALRGIKTPFGIIPMGSANGMAKEMVVPSDPIEAFHDLIMSKVIVPLDLICINNHHYSIHLGDIGINASMVENFSREANRGWLAYAKHFVDAVKNSPQFDVTINIDDNTYRHKAFSVLFANTRMYGTGAIVNPKGNPHDGKFEIVVIKQNDLSGLINLGLTAITEKALEALEGYSEIYQVTKATIELKEPKVLQLDGEIIGKTKTINAEIIPAGVRYISTNDSTFIESRSAKP